jgi:hypothetical protein
MSRVRRCRFQHAALLALVVAMAPGAARGAGPRLLLDRVEIEPSSFSGLARVRVYVTAVQLEGALIEAGGGEPFTLLVNGARRREPYLSGRFKGTAAPAAVVLVVETGWEMRDDLETVKDELTQLLASAPPGTEVAVLAYGENIDGGHRLQPLAQATTALAELEIDPAPAEPQLLAAIERAIGTLSRTGGKRAPAAGDQPPPARRLIVVVSDGKDLDPEPSRYREVGERAEREGVRIHSLAYSPVDNRRPLLGLGELSKRSGGTFRWVRSREGFRGQIDTLAAELNQQVVLTWFLPADQVVGKRLQVSFQDLTSNEVKVKKLECGGKACAARSLCARGRCVAWGTGGGRPWWMWALWIGGGVVGLVLLAGVTGALIGKLRARAPRAGPPAMPPPMHAPARPSAHMPVAPGPAPMPPPAMGHIAAGAGPVLLIMAGPFQGQRFPLRHGFLVGSARGCDLFLPDPQVAPHHAIFLMDSSGSWAILDRGSVTGIFVNGVRVTETRLQHGNVVRIGSCEIRYLGG